MDFLSDPPTIFPHTQKECVLDFVAQSNVYYIYLNTLLQLHMTEHEYSIRTIKILMKKKKYSYQESQINDLNFI